MKDIKRPWHPPVYDEFITASIRSLFAGKATEHQQKQAIEWILWELCGVRDLSFRPDSVRDTDFAEGKRFVGLQLVKISKIPPGAVAKADDARRQKAKGALTSRPKPPARSA